MVPSSIKRFLLLLVSVAPFLAFIPVYAIDPGVAQGSLQVSGSTISFTHAYALLHNNAEKKRDRPQELRILLVDREVPQSTLSGTASVPATHMAREGRLQGLLIQLDPDNRKQAMITLLHAPADPAQSLATQRVSGSRDVIRNLTIANNRVSGEVTSSDSDAGASALPKVGYRVKFSAPLFKEPATR